MNQVEDAITFDAIVAVMITQIAKDCAAAMAIAEAVAVACAF